MLSGPARRSASAMTMSPKARPSRRRSNGVRYSGDGSGWRRSRCAPRAAVRLDQRPRVDEPAVVGVVLDGHVVQTEPLHPLRGRQQGIGGVRDQETSELDRSPEVRQPHQYDRRPAGSRREPTAGTRLGPGLLGAPMLALTAPSRPRAWAFAPPTATTATMLSLRYHPGQAAADRYPRRVSGSTELSRGGSTPAGSPAFSAYQARTPGTSTPCGGSAA